MFGLVIRKVFKLTRYFIVFYIASEKDGRHTGMMEFNTTGGHYLPENRVKAIIYRRNASRLKDIVITNIIELSKSDFKDWNPKSTLIN